MALIKGVKFPPAGGGEEPEPQNEDKQQLKEEPIRRGGLIKGSSYRSKNGESGVSAFAPLPESPHQKKSKVLKSWNTSIMKMADDLAEEQGVPITPKETAPLNPDIGFAPASFMTQPGGAVPKPPAQSNEVVTIPSRKKPQNFDLLSGKKPAATPPAEEEFKVIEEPQAPPQPKVDVEALIREAERKGQEQAAKIIEHAQEEAKRLIDQAKVYGETAKQEAHQEGFKLGKEDGYKAGLAEFQAMMQEVKNLINQVVQERNRVLDTVEPELAKLSIGIAEKILGEELTMNPDVVVGVVKQAVTKLRSRERITVKVNPEDLPRAQENKDVFASLVDGLKELNIIADPRVDKGGCLIETDMGNTDARLKTQLSAIETAFRNLETGTYI